LSGSNHQNGAGGEVMESFAKYTIIDWMAFLQVLLIWFYMAYRIKCGSRQPDKLVMGMGHMTRANSEDCLFAVKGKLPPRINAGIVQSFTAPRLEHSRKPDVVREKLVQLLGDVSRIELFARQTSHGFDVWGNQCEDPAVQLHPGYALDIGGLTNAFSNAPLSPTDNQGRERAA
jgi:hypothetical protein